MHIIYTWHISFIFSTCDIIEIFGPLFHRSVKRERKCSALRWVGNRKCKIKGGGESHVWSTHHCSHMHVSSLLWDEEKISVCRELEAGSKILKILWKVKRFRKIFVTFFYEWTIVWTIIPPCFGSIGCSSPRVVIERFERLHRPGWDASVILSGNSQCLRLNNQVIPPSTQIL